MDTIPTIDKDFVKKQLRNSLLEEGKLHEATSAAKKNGIQCKAAISQTLFDELYPYAEDANHGVTWEEILYDIFKIFRKNYMNSIKTYGEFAITTKTYVKAIYRKHGEESRVLNFADGKPRDKRIEIFVSWIPDEDLNPSLVFGLKEKRFF